VTAGQQAACAATCHPLSVVQVLPLLAQTVWASSAEALALHWEGACCFTTSVGRAGSKCPLAWWRCSNKQPAHVLQRPLLTTTASTTTLVATKHVATTPAGEQAEHTHPGVSTGQPADHNKDTLPVCCGIVSMAKTCAHMPIDCAHHLYTA